MYLKKLSPVPLASLCSAALCFSLSTAYGTEYFWDHSDSAHWGRSSNWNSGGVGGHPSSNTNDAYLVYKGMAGVGGQGVGENNMDLKISDNNSNTVNFTTRIFYIATNASNHDWVLNNDGATGKIKVHSGMYFDLAGSGSAVINSNLELGDDYVPLKGFGNRAILNGELIGGTNAALDGATSGTRPNGDEISGGGLELRASTNDSFLGTIRTGSQSVKVTQVNGLRYATIEMHENDSFEYPSGAVIGALSGDADLTLSTPLTVGYNNKGTVYTGALKGSSNITKTGSAVWELGGDGTHTGNFYLGSGRIRMQNNGGYNTALKDSKVYVNVDDGLYFNFGSVNIGGLAGSKDVNIGANTLLIDGNFDSTHSGRIYGAGVLEINTSGSQELASANTYSGGTRHLGGTLKINAPSDLGNNSGALTMGSARFNATLTHTQSRELKFEGSSANAEFDVNSSKTLTWAGAINDSSGGQKIQKTGDGNLAFTNNANAFNGLLDIDAGVVRLTETTMEEAELNLGVNNGLSITNSTATVGVLTGSGDLVVGSGKTLSVGASNSSGTYSGDMSGAGSVEKVGTSRWSYSGNSTLTGDVIVKDGALVLLGNVSTASIGDIEVDSGGAIWGYGRSSGSLTVNGVVAPYSTLRANTITLNGSYNCEVAGTGSDKLQADGALNVSGGSLVLQFPSGAPNQAAYVLANYGSLTGTFSSVSGLPSGYKIDYAYSGSNIAMVQDNTAPAITSITPVTASPTTNSSVQFSVVFNEEVKNFDALADLTITKAASANYSGGTVTTADGITYTVTLTGVTGDGDLSVAVSASNGVEDIAGNDLASSPTSSAVTVDNTDPTVASITPVTGSPTNSASVSYSVVFDEEVTGFDSFTDISLGKTGTANATTATFSTSDNITYTVTLTDVVGDGDLTLSVVTGSNVQDGAGTNLASSVTSSAVEVDNTRPQITSFTTAENSPSTANSIAYSITFSEPMNGLVDGSDLYITAQTVATVDKNDATVVNAGDDMNYTVTLNNISGDGSLGFRPAIHLVKDQAGNSLVDDSSIYSPSMIIDNTDPTVASITPITSSPTNSGSVSFSVVFDEAVTGFDNFADLSLGKTDTANATGASFSSADDITYTVTLTGVSGNGDLTLGVVTGAGVQDLVSHNLTSSVTSAAVTVDNVAPTVVSVTPVTSSPSSSASVSYTVVFDEAVTGFDSFADLSLGKTDTVNATTASFSTADNITFTVTLTDVSGDGDLMLGVVTGSNVQDAAGHNLATSVTSAAVTVDNTAPSVASITLLDGTPTKLGAFSFEVIFDENVVGFDSFTDLTIGKSGTANATGASFYSADNVTHIVTLTGISGDGDLTLAVVTGAGVQDAVNQHLSSSVTSAAVTVDNTAPAVTSITPVTSSPTNSASVSFTVVFDEEVTGFDSFADLSLGKTGSVNTTAATFSTADNITHTVTLTDVSGDGELTLAVVTGAGVQDLVVQNLSSSVTSAAVVIDNTAPEITLLGAAIVNLKEGVSWTDPGASATDELDASVSVSVGGDSVDSSTLGDYTITYDATDSAGNAANQETRTVSVVAASVIYVDITNDAGGVEDGLSWNSAYGCLQDALDALDEGAVQPIYMAQGAYYPDSRDGYDNDPHESFIIPSGVRIYGGYAGGSAAVPASTRDPLQYITVLSGDLEQNDTNKDASGILLGSPESNIVGANSQRVVFCRDGDNSTIIDGLTITAAHADGSSNHDGGAGMRVDGGNVQLDNVNFIGNWNTGNSRGAGLQVDDGTVQLTRCSISSNTSTQSNAGLYTSRGETRLRQCSIESNSALNGGGLGQEGGSLTLEKCYVRGNSASQSGGGIYVWYGADLIITDSLISGNLAGQSGGGMYHTNGGAYLYLTNSTVAGNYAAGGGTGGVFVLNTYTATLTNSIISGNDSAFGIANFELFEGQVQADHSLLEGVTFADGGGGSGGTGGSGGSSGGGPSSEILNVANSLTTTNSFVDAQAPSSAPNLLGDYQLVASSAALDAGNPSGAYVQLVADIQGRYRVLDGDKNGSTTIDMGAFELQMLNQIEQWRDQYGLAIDGSEDLLDLAGDGITARMKYAFNMGDPYDFNRAGIDLANPDEGGLPVLTEADGVVVFSYIEPVNAAGNIYVTVEGSRSLGQDSWEYYANFGAIILENSTELLEGGKYQLRQIKVDVSKEERIFFRSNVGKGV